jgi:hypothetical protein
LNFGILTIKTEAENMKAKTFLPIFSGFYNTIFEFDYSNIEYDIQNERKQKGLYSDFDEIEIDNEKYEYDIVTSFCHVLKSELSEYIFNIELQKIVSPKTYNFANDSANVIITYDAEKVRDFIYSHKSAFETYLKARYTSYDGFISWYKNDFESWETETKNFLDFSANWHFLGSILEFIARIEKISEEKIAGDILENIYSSEYVKNYDDLVNQMDGSLFELLTNKGIERGFAEYIETSFNNGLLASLSLSEKVLSVIREFENQEANA